MNPSLPILVFSLLIRITLSVNPKFEACKPRTCGNGPNISYPFYIETQQDPFCGFPRFGLFCAPDGFPMLNISGSFYEVQEIFYSNHSLRVSDPTFSIPDPNTCLSPTKNLTLHGDRFNFAPNQTELRLFFGCDSSERLQENRVGCSKESKTRSVLALPRDEEDYKLGYAKNNCGGGMMRTMVEDYGETGIGDALRRGFVLKWKASDCEACENSGGRCGFDYTVYSFRCHCRDGDRLFSCPSAPAPGRKILKLALGVGLAPFGVAIMCFLAYCFIKKPFPNTSSFSWAKNHSTHQIIEAFLKEHGSLPCRRYSYSEIQKVTNNFKIKLGQGGYGSVYKGKLPSGRLVAVKVLSELKGTGEEFINEVASISRTSHVNIVNLLGFCFQGSKRALVYEFMPNGSLEKFINEANENIVIYQLNCKTMCDISVGVARGLEYLHRGCNTRILHFDIKPHNILLDENFCPRISDFGFAKVCQRKESIVSLLGARGTIGYIAPEVFCRSFGEVSTKSDVYSYGMMIIEIVGGRKNEKVQVDCSSEIYFPHWIYKHLELNQELGLRCIKNDVDEEIVRKMIVVSLWCIQTNPSARPTMSKVVEMLEGSVGSLQVPPKPYLFSPSRSPPHYSTNI